MHSVQMHKDGTYYVVWRYVANERITSIADACTSSGLTLEKAVWIANQLNGNLTLNQQG